MKHRSAIRLAAAGSVIVGSAVGGAVTIAAVGAQDDDTTTTSVVDEAPASTEMSARGPKGAWVGDVLDGLVEDETLTREQADKVAAALEAARPEHGRGHGGHGGHGRGHVTPGLVAETIGIEPAALREALAAGQSIAEVAEANDVDPQKVIDALVASVRAHTEEAVADGRVTQERADARLAELTERIGAMVNGEGPGPLGGLGRGPGRGHDGHHGDIDDDAEVDDDAERVTTTAATD